ncbi:MAG: TonB-dependent receptor [Acidobacteria bacterium]|nr:TonB-dependent receptor [Acidobacteriota bacterium]
MHKSLFSIGRVAALIALGAPILLADGAQTGTISGTVKSTAGVPLAGATVQIQGPSMQGTRRAATEANGEYRFLLVPPGVYRATVTKDGFQPLTVSITVALNQTTRADLPMAAVGAATVEVVASVSTIETESVTNQTNVTKELVDRLPVGRTYQGMMLLTPGVTGGSNPTVLGGYSGSNIYLIDGVDTTDPTTGTFGLNLAEDSIEEVQVLTSGISAEFGRFQGAVANVLTKSGSNKWEGSVRYNFSNVAWNADAPMTTTKPPSNLVKTPFVTLSGPILKDRLWFFASFQIPKTSSTQYTTGPLGSGGVAFDRVFKADPQWYSAKLTWAMTPNHTLILQSTGDPAIIPYVLYGTTTTLDTTTKQGQGGNFYSLSYRGMLGKNVTLEAKYAKQESKIEVWGNGGNRWIFYDQNDAAGRQYENGPFEGYVKRPRTQFNLALSWFPEAAGSHEIRVGMDSQKTDSKNKFGAIGDTEVYFSGFTGSTGYPVFSNGIPTNYNIDPDYDFLAVYSHPVESKSTQKFTAIYINDKWKFNKNWGANIGLRYEKVDGTNDVGQNIWNYNTVSPRMGLTYDLDGDSRRTLSLFYGVYYQAPWQDGLDQYNKLSQSYSLYGYAGGNPHSRSSWDSSPFYTFNPTSDPGLITAPDLKGPRTNETTLIYKWQVTSRFSFTASGVYKEFKDQIVQAKYYDYAPGSTTNVIKYFRLENAKNSIRHYAGLMATGEYRGDKWYFMGNYTYSELRGNIDQGGITGSFNAFNRGLWIPAQPLAGNLNGILGADQPHVLRLFLARRATVLDWFTIDNGFRFTYSSGTPYNIAATWSMLGSQQPSFVLSSDRSQTVYYGNVRGLGRFNSTYGLDYTVTFDWAIAKKYHFFLRADITNILNHQEQATWSTSSTLAYPSTSDRSRYYFVPGSTFGKPTGSGNYITPRTLGFSAGFKF